MPPISPPSSSGDEGESLQALEMTVDSLMRYPRIEDFEPIDLETSRGVVECRYYASEGEVACIWVGGVGGGWDSPAGGIYDRWCRELLAFGIASLRVRYRDPIDLEESALDVLAGTVLLEGLGKKRIGLTGHSFGGAVVAQAAASSPLVHAVACLSPQTMGLDAIAAFRGASLFVHGRKDQILPYRCSEYGYRLAREPKRLVLYDEARHGLDEVKEPLFGLVKHWMVEQLSAKVRPLFRS